MTNLAIGGRVETLPLSALDLDHENPRLPLTLRDDDAGQSELALHIDKHNDALRVARSIDRHGFFTSEPLIGVPSGDRYTIVEGNRRLVALKGLADPELRASLEAQTPGWRSLGTLPSDAEIPVVVVEARHQVDALLGFRHISGIEPWDPFAQARFVADLVERNGDFAEVAQIVGRSETEVRSMYRDHDIVEQAKTEFDLDTSRVEKSFGVFSAAMGLVKLREYVGAPAPRHVDAETYPIPDESAKQLARLLEYIFGDERGRGRVITDSRQLRTLARVLSDDSGNAERVLRQSRDLQEALDATVSHEVGARTELQKASRALARVRGHIAANGFSARELIPMVDVCEATLRAISDDLRRTEA